MVLLDPVLFVFNEKSNGVISRAHLATGHVERHRLHTHLILVYVIIQRESVEFEKKCTLSREKSLMSLRKK